MSIVPWEVVRDIRETWPARDMPLYEYAIERAAQWALEQAAKACESLTEVIVSTHPARVEFDPNSMTARRCAAAIRALISPEGKIKGGESDGQG